jgi:hypothetical protein
LAGVFNSQSPPPFVKDAFHRYVIHGERGAVNPESAGTKAAAYFASEIAPGKSWTIRLRLTNQNLTADNSGALQLFGPAFEQIFDQRVKEANDFYSRRIDPKQSEDARSVQRQAFAGLLWCKQSYHYDVRRWLAGDSTQPKPDPARYAGRNHDWTHLYNSDVISMPDKWEYPWYASWDLAFHCVSLALVDPEYAKELLVLFHREWYMSPSGQIPAYEWNFSDVNPPVQAWALWRVYKIAGRVEGAEDRNFLERVFLKLLLNFTWWVNRKDPEARPWKFYRTIRWHQLDGDVLPGNAGHGHGTGARRSDLRRYRQQIFRAFCLHRPSNERHGRRWRRPVGRERRFLLRCAASRALDRGADESPVDGRFDSTFCGGGL